MGWGFRGLRVQGVDFKVEPHVRKKLHRMLLCPKP